MELQRAQFENVARNEYTKSDAKNPVDCSLYYLALKKKTVLQGLWRMAYGNREQATTQRFLANNFDDPVWRTKALKNAYALLSKRRFGEYLHVHVCSRSRLADVWSDRVRGRIFPASGSSSGRRQCLSQSVEGSPARSCHCKGLRRRSGTGSKEAIGRRGACTGGQGRQSLARLLDFLDVKSQRYGCKGLDCELLLPPIS